MKYKLSLILLASVLHLFACAQSFQEKIPTNCTETGTVGVDRVPHPTQGFDIPFQYYLPPCYDETNSHFPVLYLITMPDEQQLDENANTPMSLADRLIRDRKLAPVILIIPKDTVAHGYHAALATDLIPFVDEKFKSLRERPYRGVGGISHGAAIAARLAFQFPHIFGSLGVFSGGIAPSETSAFEAWISSTVQQERPRVLIDIGDQDGILPLTQNLMNVLDSQNVRYELNVATGGHSWEFWSTRMESFLLWFAEAWE
jgi:enterochelin esterase-like enzyme